ncbi:MAG: 1-(5-phosphoribosyl)-5-[(5-phosphoribosylamino)methylideneamino]imidazole-4-carboxamide isomerase [Rhodospirillales bacterium]
MIFFPAIDLKDGACVRLLRGDMNAATVYGQDPAAQARAFAAAGCEWLHVVDLNGAVSGKPVNSAAVEAILTAAPELNVQLGGGVRDMAAVEHWLGRGAARVVLGTAALKNPDFVREACRAFRGRIAVGIDARGGMAAAEGWTETSDISAVDLAQQLEDAGAAAVITTDIDRDGALNGPNLGAVGKLAAAVKTPVILSGGVRSLHDLRAAALITPPIDGVISGRAVYEGALDAGEAVRLLAAMAH